MRTNETCGIFELKILEGCARRVGLLRHNRYIDNKFYYFEVICFELNVNVITGSCESIFGTKVQVQVHPKKLFLLIYFNV